MARGRYSIGILAVVVAFALALPVSAHAAPASAAALKARIDALNAEVAGAGSAFVAAQNGLEDTEAQIAATDASIAETRRQLAKQRARLRGRAADIYRVGQPDVIGLLLGSTSVGSFMARLDYFSAIAEQDADAVSNVRTLGTKLRTDRKKLAVARASIAARVKARRRTRELLQAQLRSRQAEYTTLRAQLAAAQAREKAAAAAHPAAAAAAPKSGAPVATTSKRHRAPTAVHVSASGLVFPVAGPNYFSDTWGEARSGGRSHLGTDIMAAYGVPVVACTSGTVRTKYGPNGGNQMWVNGSKWSTFYAHLSSYAVRSGHVNAGQVIGYVGATGNAGGPHLHFEMHRGGGAAVNPYPYLRAMQ
jgi:murein DD-endopeptidase MepM/ murein hydrolase activator NlpD